MTESKVMNTRTMLVAALAAMTITAPLGAEPTKAPAQPTGQPVNRPAEILLASAEIRAPGQNVEAAQSEAQAPAPAKRPRAARVTTCRCAGQTPQQP